MHCEILLLDIKSVSNINSGVSEGLDPGVKRSNKIDTPYERPPCSKCCKLIRGECMMGCNECYNWV